HVEATRALAKLAIFSGEEEVRHAAIAALKIRRERDYTDILVQGLRYPWPAVAQRAAEAMVKLERKDLAPQLVALLEESDPRAPVLTKRDDKQVSVVRELVRINHHRNCLLCHAPGQAGDAGFGGMPAPLAPTKVPTKVSTRGELSGFVALEDLGSGNKIENGEKNADIPLQPRTLIP